MYINWKFRNTFLNNLQLKKKSQQKLENTIYQDETKACVYTEKFINLNKYIRKEKKPKKSMTKHLSQEVRRRKANKI